MNKKLEKYIEAIEKTIIDSETKHLLIELIIHYSKSGKIKIDGNDLYGSSVNLYDGNRATPAKEFLQITIDGLTVICNYSEWSNRKVVNIVQETLKSGNTRFYKKEHIKRDTYGYNEFDTEEEEKIYNYQKKLIYKSLLEKIESYSTGSHYDDGLIYHDCSNNYFDLRREWYIEKDYTMCYRLSKNYMSDEIPSINESYGICLYPYNKENGEIKAEFKPLDEDVFMEYLEGFLTIDNLIENVKDIEKEKKLINKKIK